MAGIKQIRLSGFGGQGVILAGVLLGEAGVMDGQYVCGSNSYGAQARGSGCKSEIVFADGPIDFPHLITSDILIAMSQGSYNQYCGDVKESSGFILYDPGLVTIQENLNLTQIGIPATEYAINRLNNKQVANIVFLGALIETTQIVSMRAIQKAIQTHVSERFRALNLKALRIGIGLGRRVHG